MSKRFPRMPVYLLASSLLSALLLVLSRLLRESDGYALLMYLVDFLGRYADLLIPMLGVTLLLGSVFSARPVALPARALLLTVPHAVYALLTRYISLVDGGLSSLESLSFSLVFAIAEALLLALVYWLLLVLIARLTRRYAADGVSLGALVRQQPLLELSNPATAAIGLFGLPYALLLLITELLDTISFFSAYFDSFSFGEIAYILFSFLFVPFAYLSALALCVLLARRLLAPSQTGQQ